MNDATEETKRRIDSKAAAAKLVPRKRASKAVEDATTKLETATNDEDRKRAARELAKARRAERVAAGEEPDFSGVRDDGSVPATTDNVEALFQFYGIAMRHNVMTRDAELTIEGASFPSDIEMQAMMAHIRQLARRHRMSAGKELEDAVTCIRAANVYHPVRDWILSRPWDGVDRFEALWSTLRIRKEHRDREALYRSMLRAWLLSGAKFAMLPFDAKRGLDAHGVLVLQGEQGVGKTKWLNRLVPLDSGFMKDGVSIDPSDKDDVSRATKFWLVELGEIDATIRKSDIAALKAFLTADSDVYRRPYERNIEQFARRTFFAASVNPEMFLRDETGNRRFWVIPVEACHWHPDTSPCIESIDVQQLWAQFAAHAEAGENHVLSREMEALQREAVEAHRRANPLEDDVRRCFRLVDPSTDKSCWLSNEEVFRELARDDDQRMSQADKLKVADALAAMGASKGRRKIGGSVVRIWSVVRA